MLIFDEQTKKTEFIDVAFSEILVKRPFVLDDNWTYDSKGAEEIRFITLDAL